MGPRASRNRVAGVPLGQAFCTSRRVASGIGSSPWGFSDIKRLLSAAFVSFSFPYSSRPSLPCLVVRTKFPNRNMYGARGWGKTRLHFFIAPLYLMEAHRIFLCFRLLSALCSLIASLPYPHKRAILYRRCQEAHKPLANLISQPPGEVGRIGFVSRIIVEANGVVSSQSNALAHVGEAERSGRLAAQDCAQAIGAMRAHDRRGEGAHTHGNSRVLTWVCRVTNRVDLRVGDRTQKGIDHNLIELIHG